MQNIKHIIFDFDGVLVRNSELLLQTHRETLGPFSDEDFKLLFDGNTISGLTQYSENQIKDFWEKWREVLYTTTVDTSAQKILQLIHQHDKEKHIISSNMEDILHTILDNSSAKHLFQNILGKDTHHSKIEKFNMLKEKYDFDFQDVLFITDSLGDLKEAMHFPEMKTLAVTFGVHDKERLSLGDPDYIIDTWDELEKILNT